MTKAYDIEQKAANSYGTYWGVGPTVTVVEMLRYADARRFLCLTHTGNHCEHIDALKRYLHVPAEVAA